MVRKWTFLKPPKSKPLKLPRKTDFETCHVTLTLNPNLLCSKLIRVVNELHLQDLVTNLGMRRPSRGFALGNFGILARLESLANVKNCEKHIQWNLASRQRPVLSVLSWVASVVKPHSWLVELPCLLVNMPQVLLIHNEHWKLWLVMNHPMISSHGSMECLAWLIQNPRWQKQKLVLVVYSHPSKRSKNKVLLKQRWITLRLFFGGYYGLSRLQTTNY